MNCSSHTDCLFLGTFTKFEKRVLVLLCLSAHLHGTAQFTLQDIHENLNLNIFRKSAKIIQASLTSDKNNRYFEDACTFMIISKFFLEWEMFRMTVVEKIKTHFVFSNFFPPKIMSFMR